MTMLAKVDLEKCEKLADFLETVPPHDFDLSMWVEREPIARVAFGPIVFREGCGFAGCAMGWAAHSKLFPGLQYVKVREPNVFDITYRGAQNFEAVARLLGLNGQMPYYLFHKEYYDGDASPARVADRIRRMVSIIRARLASRSAPRLRVVA